MFGIETDEKIDESLLTSYRAWDRYVATIWSQILAFCAIDNEGIVVEIAPGASPKLAYALKQLDFSGTVYLIEPHEQAIKIITEHYRQILPNAVIHPIQTTLIDSIGDLPKTIHAAISHHPLDDMLMSLQNDPVLNEQLFSWVTEDKVEINPLFETHWQQIFNHPARLNTYKQQILDDWLFFINHAKPNNLLISQYPSLVLETASLKSLNQHSYQLLQTLKNKLSNHVVSDPIIQTLLNNNKNFNFHSIGHEVLHAKNWLIYNG